jgi:hypothetical protein
LTQHCSQHVEGHEEVNIECAAPAATSGTRRGLAGLDTDDGVGEIGSGLAGRWEFGGRSCELSERKRSIYRSEELFVRERQGRIGGER